MLTNDQIQRIADEHALSAYPFGCKAKLHLQLDEPCVSCFGPTEPTDTDGQWFGLGGFVVDRATGQVRHFSSGRLMRAAEAANKTEGKHDLAVAVRYLVTYSAEELRELAGHPRHRRSVSILDRLFGRRSA